MQSCMSVHCSIYNLDSVVHCFNSKITFNLISYTHYLQKDSTSVTISGTIMDWQIFFALKPAHISLQGLANLSA